MLTVTDPRPGAIDCNPSSEFLNPNSKLEIPPLPPEKDPSC
jgi:hypothetical protein